MQGRRDLPAVQDETGELEAFKRSHPNFGMHFRDLRGFPVHSRPLRGSASAHFELSGNRTIECHVSELAPGSHNRKHRHQNEAIIYVLSGRGHSELSDGDGGDPMTIDWQEGDLFGPPLGWWHQHFNDDPQMPARYLAFTNIGLMQRLGVFRKEGVAEATG